MNVILHCLLSFSMGWLIHFMICRVSPPKKHTRALLIIFISTLFVTLIAGLTGVLAKLSWLQAFHIAVFYIPTTLAYICFYSAIEEDSPSVGLIALTTRQGKCQIEDYAEVINDQLLIDSRLPAMVRDGLLTHSKGLYQLTTKAFVWGVYRIEFILCCN